MPSTPRPRWNDTAVRDDAATRISDRVILWCYASGILPEDALDADPEDPRLREVRAILILSMRDAPDAYRAGRYLEDFADFPTDSSLIDILADGFRLMRTCCEDHVRAWVMKEGLRVVGKTGDTARFRCGTAEITGTVAGFKSTTAILYVTVPTGGGRGMTFPVPCEDVIRVTPTKRSRRPDTPA